MTRVELRTERGAFVASVEQGETSWSRISRGWGKP
jgi:hypothetical protein